jgi:hypothetical protein
MCGPNVSQQLIEECGLGCAIRATLQRKIALDHLAFAISSKVM